jgi:hypothetical protein
MTIPMVLAYRTDPLACRLEVPSNLKRWGKRGRLSKELLTFQTKRASVAIGTSRHSLRRNNSVAFGEKRTLTNRCLPASIYEHARRCAVVAAPA